MKACTAAEMREIDRRAVEEYGMPSIVLMENAGAAVARRLIGRTAELVGDGFDHSRVGPVVALCGKGNNGGDGFVAARHLHSRGIPVSCWLASDPDDVKGDARVNLDLAQKLGIPVRSFREDDEELAEDLADDLNAGFWVIDALLGTGFNGEPRGAVAAMLRILWEEVRPVIAVDVPSGLNADTGQRASVYVNAEETVTFGLPKLGLLSYPGRGMAGRLTVADISLPCPLLEECSAEWITSVRVASHWWPRGPMAHKGDSGRVFVLAGSPGMTGAAALTCDAALRAGAGLVTLGIPRGLNPILEVKLTEAMTVPLPETDTGGHCPESLETVREFAGRGALAVGPGFGRDPRSGELVRKLLGDCPAPMVVDADALYLASPADGATFPERCVVTPHPGEMARLLGTETAAVESDRVGTARVAAERFGCVVVLKGPATVVAAPDGRLGVNSSGSAALATGGTGDTLTGIVAACLARGLEPYEAAVAAVFLHGLAGEIAEEWFGAPGAVAGDVTAAIPEAIRRLGSGKVGLPCRIES